VTTASLPSAFDLDELLIPACAGAGSAGAKNPFAERKRVRTTSVIDRCFRGVGRRIRSKSVFSDRTSMDRILFAVFEHETKPATSVTLLR
jgi:hypothetical protein